MSFADIIMIITLVMRVGGGVKKCVGISAVTSMRSTICTRKNWTDATFLRSRGAAVLSKSALRSLEIVRLIKSAGYGRTH